MTLRKLEKREDGNFVCPECGKPLRFKDGETVAVIDGQLDMENYKPRYICDDCQVYYRSVLTTDYYDVFPLDDAEPSKEANGEPEASAEMPQGKTLSMPKESAVRKALPTLCALRMLSSTTASPEGGRFRYASADTRPSSIFSNFLSFISTKLRKKPLSLRLQ